MIKEFLIFAKLMKLKINLMKLKIFKKIRLFFITKQTDLKYNEKPERKIILNSYTCSGVSWLLNCLLELGIRSETSHNKWFRYVKKYNDELDEYEYLQIPIGLNVFAEKKDFYFKNNLFCDFQEHGWSRSGLQSAHESKTIILIRDPRDTLWSVYNTHLNHPLITNLPGFEDFCKEHSLYWKQFYEMCLALPNVSFFRFEDYKSNPFQHLRNILTFMDVKCTDREIEKAISNSVVTYSGRGIYRSGKVSQWKELPEYKEAFFHVQETTKDIMKLFSYE